MAFYKTPIKNTVPKHVAFIMDGNGRWAKLKNMPRILGHKEGIKVIKKVIDFSMENKIKYLTLYAFSMENWGRSKDEVSDLMEILRSYFSEEIEKLYKKNICIKVIGNKSLLPTDIQQHILDIESATKQKGGLFLNIALSYGSRQEIVDVVNLISSDIQQGILKDLDINCELFNKYLKKYDYPDPDLLIRTGGEKRLSNFLLWQMAYTELYFTDVLWPDFDKNHFESAISEFKIRERRYGTA